jgi:hypothetical protein
MRKIVTTVAGASLALVLATAAPTSASANPILIAPVWFALAIGGAVAGGAVVGASAAHANDAGPGPTPDVYVTGPDAGTNCHFTHGMVNGVWRRVQVCD